MAKRFGIDGSVLFRTAAGGAICLSTGGCFLFGSGRPQASLVSNDPGAKIPAIKKASNASDSETAQHLVKSLESDDPAVRFYAIRGLQNLSGETFGYIWYDDEPQRRGAMEKWKQWLDASHAGSFAGAEREPK